MTDLSLIKLFINASFVVQLVMVILLIASVVSWTFIFHRSRYLHRVQGALDEFEFTFWSGIDLSKLYNQLSAQKEPTSGLSAIFLAGFKEFVRLRKQSVQEPTVLLEAVQRAMKVSLQKETAHLETHLPILATVQSTSPYIGLFGTVWGIVYALQALGTVQQASLNLVAPGISEALVATAMGLVAAIPAGIAYNRFANRADVIGNRYRIFVDELTGMMHRRIHSVLTQEAAT